MIRQVRSEDKKAYVQMAKEFYSTGAVLAPVPEKHFEDAFDFSLESDVFSEIFIFEEEDGIAGYALTAKTYSQEAGGRVLWLEEIYVRPEFRHRGIASSFLEFSVGRMKTEGIKRIRLEVEKENEGAVRLYEKYGFRFFPYDQMIKE